MMFLACLLTLLIETPFLAVCGFNKRDEIIIIICTNVVTNLLLNLLIAVAFHSTPGYWIYVMEAAVVAVEYAVYSFGFGRSWKLLGLTLAANCLSYGVGLLLF